MCGVCLSPPHPHVTIQPSPKHLPGWLVFPSSPSVFTSHASPPVFSLHRFLPRKPRGFLFFFFPLKGRSSMAVGDVRLLSPSMEQGVRPDINATVTRGERHPVHQFATPSSLHPTYSSAANHLVCCGFSPLGGGRRALLLLPAVGPSLGLAVWSSVTEEQRKQSLFLGHQKIIFCFLHLLCLCFERAGVGWREELCSISCPSS